MNTTIKKRIEDINNGQVPEGYEKTSFGIFPCDWEKDELKHLGEFGKGKGIPGNKMTDEGVPCVGYGDIYMKYNYHFEKAQSFVDIETAKESQLIKKGTLLFTGTGETAEEIGKCVCYNGEEDIYAGGDIITFVANKINPLFLSYQQYLDFALKQKASFGQGHSVVHIQKGNLEKLNCAYPKTEREQSRIAQILMQWDKTIELQKKLIKSYQKLKKYYLSKMFPKKGSLYPEIRFAGFTEPWEMRNLGDIGTTYGGLTGKTKEDFRHGDAKFVTYMNVFTNPIGKPDMTESVEYDSSQNEVKKGDVLFTTSSETPEEVGMSCVWMEDLPNTYLNSFCFGYRPIMDFDLHYLAYVLRSDSIRQKIILLAQGISRYNISKSKVMELNIPIPTKEEQRLLGAFFENIDNLISCYQNNLDKLIAQRKALMQVLLTGIVRVV